MIEWFWLPAVGLLALVLGYAFGGWWIRRSLEDEIAQRAEDAAITREKSAVASERVRALEVELAIASSRADKAEHELGTLVPQLAAASDGVTELKQLVADATTARRASEAALAVKESERQKAVDQASAARAGAAEASERYDAITAEFVTLKRSLRDALDSLARAEAERDARILEAASSADLARAGIAEIEHARNEEVAAAHADRDQAIAAMELANQRRVDAGALRSEIMSAQRELADLREELGRKDRQIRELVGHGDHPAPGPDPAAKAFAGFDPEAGSAVSDEEMAAAVAAIADPLDDEGDGEGDEPDALDDDDILTVDDLPGGDWEPDPHLLPAWEPENAPTSVPEPKQENAVAASVEDAGSVEEPIVDAVHEGGRPDNLRLVKGIGPKFEKLLHARNVTTFAQIAAISDDAEWESYLDTFAGRIDREQWREQAGELHKQHHK